MSELIDRQAAIEELKSYIVDPERAISENPDDVFQYNSGIRTAIGVITELRTSSPWHRVEDDPPDGNEDAVIYYEWTGISGRVYRETSIISLNELIVLGRRPIAWTEKPEPQKEENKEGFVALAIKETERSEE